MTLKNVQTKYLNSLLDFFYTPPPLPKIDIHNLSVNPIHISTYFLHACINPSGWFCFIQFAYYSLKYSKCIPTKFPLLFICAKIEQDYKKGHYSPISTHPCQSAFSRSFTQCLILLNNIHLTLFTHTI